MTVPAPAAEPDALSDEDKAFRALADAPDAEPTAAPPPRRERAQWDDPPPRREPPKAKAKAAPRTPASDGWPTGYEPEPRRPRIHISSGVLGGAGMMLGAVVWFVVGLAAGILFIYPPIMFVIGLVTFVRALFGHED